MSVQKIIRFEATNIQRLKAVEIFPDGRLVVLGGNNDAGKSSVLQSICMALGGKNYVPEVPIREGQTKASVVIETQDLIVTRKFSASTGTSLTVTTKNGMPLSSPQAVLDKLVGKLSFDPLEFSRMASREPKKAAEVVRKLVGLDFTEMDNKRAALYAQRTDKNREATQLSARLTSMPFHSDAPAELVDVEALTSMVKAARQANATNEKNRVGLIAGPTEAIRVAEQDIYGLQSKILNSNQRLAEIDAEILALQSKRTRIGTELAEQKEQLETAQLRRSTNVAVLNEAQETVKQIVDEDVNALVDKMGQAETINAKVRANKERHKLKLELADVESASSALTTKIEEIDTEKTRLLSEAKFPVPEISFNDSGVLLNGLPFAQGSTAMQIRASMAISLAMNPELRIVLIKDASLLDENSMKVIAEMAEQADSQIWLEVVTNDPKRATVIIEDGSVKE